LAQDRVGGEVGGRGQHHEQLVVGVAAVVLVVRHQAQQHRLERGQQARKFLVPPRDVAQGLVARIGHRFAPFGIERLTNPLLRRAPWPAGAGAAANCYACCPWAANLAGGSSGILWRFLGLVRISHSVLRGGAAPWMPRARPATGSALSMSTAERACCCARTSPWPWPLRRSTCCATCWPIRIA